MGPTFLPVIDLGRPLEIPGGLTPKQLSYFKYVHITLTTEDLDAALERLGSTFGQFEASFDVTSLSSIDDIVALLDAGAAQIFVNTNQWRSLSSVENLDQRRLVLSAGTAALDELEKICESVRGSVCLPNVPNIEAVKSCVSRRRHEDGPVYVGSNATFTLQIAELKAVPMLPIETLSLDPSPSSSVLDASQLFLAGAVSDRPDGLFTTLVADERGIALGLVYSSKKSVAESLRLGRGVYHSRKRGLWYKGDTSGDIQELVYISFDCDADCLYFTVRQLGRGFCHLDQASCFGAYRGMSRLSRTLQSRKESAPPGSYTSRLFNDSDLLNAKIKEEANELCEASNKKDVAFEAADLIYFALTKCTSAGVSLEDVEKSLDAKNLKVKRRKGDAKSQFLSSATTTNGVSATNGDQTDKEEPNARARIRMTRYVTSQVSPDTISEALKRPSQRSTDAIMGIVKPIVDNVSKGGDGTLLGYTHKFEKATTLTSPVIHAPFPSSLMQLPPETKEALDLSFENIRKFHAAQQETKALEVETMPGVVCSRFSRAIERVGLYIPGGTAVLPSTALMLGVPAMVAGCKKIVLATPPRQDGSVTPEVVYVAHRIGAESIVLAGGAQAVAAMAYGTETISKVDKILGPGNQFVTAGKMLVSNDTNARVSIDMPAGPSEVLVVADATSRPAFVASDLLSQAEHGADSQVICIAVDLDETQLSAIEDELHRQALALPRVDIVRKAIDHSVTLVTKDIKEAMGLVNEYAPEHLIIQTAEPRTAAAMVENAGSVFVGPWTPESVGDYSAGVNHSLPTYGYARQYSGVNLASYIKHITSSELTQEGLRNVSGAVMQLATVEELEAHKRAVSIRMDHIQSKS